MDKLTQKQRSENMRAVKSKGTKLEERVNKELWRRGLRFRKNSNKLYGKRQQGWDIESVKDGYIYIH